MIRLLPPNLINQIAAGEVVERPASAVKELVENAIDAGARKIEVTLREGGRTLILVEDDGKGMSREDLILAVERHATSKIPEEDLFNIHTLGFRGEALPSIGSVSRLTLISGQQGAESAWKIQVEGGLKSEPEPASFSQGTRIEVRDLFYATPARLKFLKTTSTELAHTIEMLNRLAMVYPEISFRLRDEKREIFHYPAVTSLATPEGLLQRLTQIIGKDFADNIIQAKAERDDLKLEGYISVPTFNRANAQHQYLFVNRRPVKDKVLSAALRVAYQDFLARDRYPQGALFLTLPSMEVDLNVHPAKIEVRFRDAQAVRNLIIGGLKHALTQAGHRTSTTIAQDTFNLFKPSTSGEPKASQSSFSFPLVKPALPLSSYRPFSQEIEKKSPMSSFEEQNSTFRQTPLTPSSFSSTISEAIPFPRQRETSMPEEKTSFIDPPSFSSRGSENLSSEEQALFLGKACAQIHQTYIIAESSDGLIIIDQHAAHERLVYEHLKEEFKKSKIKSQGLLVPEIVPLPETDVQCLMHYHQEFAGFGLEIDAFSSTAILVRATPALLGNPPIQQLILDLLDEIRDLDESTHLQNRLHEVCSSMACHSSIRAGRRLNFEEMNALLRQMETTPHAGQCNHGRPTYIKLKKDDIEKLFGRT